MNSRTTVGVIGAMLCGALIFVGGMMYARTSHHLLAVTRWPVATAQTMGIVIACKYDDGREFLPRSDGMCYSEDAP